MCLLSGMFVLTILCCFLACLSERTLGFYSVPLSVPHQIHLPLLPRQTEQDGRLVCLMDWRSLFTLLLYILHCLHLSSCHHAHLATLLGNPPLALKPVQPQYVKGMMNFSLLYWPTVYHGARASESFVVFDFVGMCCNIYMSQVHGSRCRVEFPS